MTINGVAAPLLFADATQINVQVPVAGSPANVNVTVMNENNIVGTGVLNVQSVSPGLFTFSGQAAVVNQDGSVNSSAQPAAAGSFISAYLTGLGAVTNPVGPGAAAPSNPLSTVTGIVTAAMAGQAAQVLFAGLAPGFAGLYQVNLVVPQLAAGNYPLQISVNGVAGNPAPVSIR